MPRIELQTDPYQLDLFCPFCGKHIVGSEGEGFSDVCDHTICVGIDDPDEDNILNTDIVFVAHEGGPADRDHVFAFREPS